MGLVWSVCLFPLKRNDRERQKRGGGKRIVGGGGGVKDVFGGGVCGIFSPPEFSTPLGRSLTTIQILFCNFFDANLIFQVFQSHFCNFLHNWHLPKIHLYCETFGMEYSKSPKMVRRGRKTAVALKTLTSLNKASRPFFLGDHNIGVFPLFLPLAVTASGGPESCFSLAIIAFGALEFDYRKCFNHIHVQKRRFTKFSLFLRQVSLLNPRVRTNFVGRFR